MRLLRKRFSLRSLLILVAVAGILLGGERLWRRSKHYRKQAALCAYFELQCRHYAATDMEEDNWAGLTLDEKRENARLNLISARRFGILKNIYQRAARHPWESLPPDTPVSVNGWDLGSLSASEIEEMVRDWKEAPT
ncbi:hypothetical protein Sinac_3676 [Singulisphaera acidiphila DSM 18658]|uniref:Uncharacterized protein n=1 Tax=Singulisphaera acidiphila (strain ATCC BAA-1392 / DSM 18658 / VKM B-2454 / MOB10) TaxID=886293 RepID=L0DF97_SINAD|nr:hypothetical protein Sinac_3676 [Singulisphaera acidiphila DSM 18658]